MNQQKPEHSPLPWGKAGLEIRSFGLIATVSDKVFDKDVAHANAEFIVRAVNNHYQLLKVCKSTSSALIDGRTNSDHIKNLKEVIADVEEYS